MNLLVGGSAKWGESPNITPSVTTLSGQAAVLVTACQSTPFGATNYTAQAKADSRLLSGIE
jgi:hypothetical protein